MNYSNQTAPVLKERCFNRFCFGFQPLAEGGTSYSMNSLEWTNGTVKESFWKRKYILEAHSDTWHVLFCFCESFQTIENQCELSFHRNASCQRFTHHT